MKELFPAYYSLTDDELNTLWKNCLFVLDTNVLLDLYRLPNAASNDLLKILKDPAVSGRLWIPFQAALEYQNNRLRVIGDQINRYGEVREALEKAEIEFKSVYSDLNEKLQQLQLKKRHSQIDPEKFINDNFWRSIIDPLKNFTQELDNLKKSNQMCTHQIKYGKRLIYYLVRIK
jgi:hypothetical protein